METTEYKYRYGEFCEYLKPFHRKAAGAFLDLHDRLRVRLLVLFVCAESDVRDGRDPKHDYASVLDHDDSYNPRSDILGRFRTEFGSLVGVQQDSHHLISGKTLLAVRFCFYPAVETSSQGSIPALRAETSFYIKTDNRFESLRLTHTPEPSICRETNVFLPSISLQYTKDVTAGFRSQILTHPDKLDWWLDSKANQIPGDLLSLKLSI